MNGRDLVRKFFRRQPVERAPFLPTAFYQAARIDGAPASDLIGAPVRLSRAVIELARLLQSDAVAIRLETAVYGACGIELSWPRPDGPPLLDGAPATAPEAATLLAVASALLGAISSVKAELRGQQAVMAVMPGPFALAARLGVAVGEAAPAAALRTLADAACKAGAELLVLEDDCAGDEAGLKRLAGPIVNTARYYSASVILSAPRAVTERIADAQLLPLAGIDAAPPGSLLGLAPAAGDLADRNALKALADRVRRASPPVFVSLDDGAMIGREMPDILAGVAALLGRA